MSWAIKLAGKRTKGDAVVVRKSGGTKQYATSSHHNKQSSPYSQLKKCWSPTYEAISSIDGTVDNMNPADARFDGVYIGLIGTVHRNCLMYYKINRTTEHFPLAVFSLDGVWSEEAWPRVRTWGPEFPKSYYLNAVYFLRDLSAVHAGHSWEEARADSKKPG